MKKNKVSGLSAIFISLFWLRAICLLTNAVIDVRAFVQEMFQLTVFYDLRTMQLFIN